MRSSLLPHWQKPVAQYVQRHAESEIEWLAGLPALDNIQYCLTIPCFDEDFRFIERLLKTPFDCPGRILVILVVNQPQGTECDNNTQLLNALDLWPKTWNNGPITLYHPNNKRQDWLVVDRTSPGLPPKQGVGLARKIAADMACKLWSLGAIQSQFVHCSDADAYLPRHYFQPTDTHFSAVIFSHRHRPHPTSEHISRATQLYDQALHYYEAGLKWAGSPYAFQTIGSTLAINLRHYAAVRGFPKRNAAEDFYLLNKVAKLAAIEHQPKICVELDSRISHRVPFGTGPAVEKILGLDDPEHDYRYYSVQCFEYLKQWIDAIPDILSSMDSGQQHLSELDERLQAAAQFCKIDKILDHIRQQGLTGNKASDAFHGHFDGFQTLKYLRFLQAQFFPAEPLCHAIRTAPFYDGSKFLNFSESND